MSRRSPLPRLMELASEQWGLITRQQMLKVGLGATTVDRLTAPRGVCERVASGVYQIVGAPIPDHRDLRAAWMQLEPAVPRWERTSDQGVVSHRSAAALYGFGHLPADRHEFTLPHRRQTRRPDVRLHIAHLGAGEWVTLSGMPVARPARIAADLLRDLEDPEAVVQVIVDALRGDQEESQNFALAIAPYAARFGLRRGDGVALFRWLLNLTGDVGANRWMAEVEAAIERPTAPSRP